MGGAEEEGREKEGKGGRERRKKRRRHGRRVVMLCWMEAHRSWGSNERKKEKQNKQP